MWHVIYFLLVMAIIICVFLCVYAVFQYRPNNNNTNIGFRIITLLSLFFVVFLLTGILMELNDYILLPVGVESLDNFSVYDVISSDEPLPEYFSEETLSPCGEYYSMYDSIHPDPDEPVTDDEEIQENGFSSSGSATPLSQADTEPIFSSGSNSPSLSQESQELNDSTPPLSQENSDQRSSGPSTLSQATLDSDDSQPGFVSHRVEEPSRSTAHNSPSNSQTDTPTQDTNEQTPPVDKGSQTDTPQDTNEQTPPVDNGSQNSPK